VKRPGVKTNIEEGRQSLGFRKGKAEPGRKEGRKRAKDHQSGRRSFGTFTAGQKGIFR